MGGCAPEGLDLSLGISTLAGVLASALSDQELAMAAALFTQLGDTLATIALRRELCAQRETPR